MMDGSGGLTLKVGICMHMYLHGHVSLHPGRRFFRFPLGSQPLLPAALRSSCAFMALVIHSILYSLL